LFEVPLEPSNSAPFYALRFDKQGRSESPLTQQDLLDRLRTGAFTDVYVFSHGWNNDYERALTRYKDFIAAYQALRAQHRVGFARPYRPLLAGIFWPSTALVMPWEQGPDFAGDEDAGDAVDISLIGELAGHVPPADLERFYALAEREALDEEEARELIGLVSGATTGVGDTDLDGDPGRDTDDLLVAWAALEGQLSEPALPASPDEFGTPAGPSAGGPQAAGLLDRLSRLNPRNLFRGLTVWEMKDRAGAVGSAGVGPALRGMLEATANQETRFHLIGHSYGARLLLTAVGRPAYDPQPRPIDSLLLLQPAVNHLCFADSLEDGRHGGFHGVPALVKQPILSTFSVHDFPLRKTFHLALRRGKDLGEIEIAAEEPPNRYAALGGYGPRGFAGCMDVTIKDPQDAYQLGGGAPEIWAVDGSRTISGHGDVVNESTAWALFNLARS
jgi:hypothetical protein